MSARVTILDAVDDANLFAPWFREPSTWAAWRAFLAAIGKQLRERTDRPKLYGA
jgi:hypothetical protein